LVANDFLTSKGEEVMAKSSKKKAHQVAGCMPTGKQWAHKKTGKAKTKNLAKLTSK
jgi:hypothetical protein